MTEVAAAHEPTDGEVAALLTRVRTIAVVGISSDPTRASHGVASYLLQRAPEYELWFVNPTETEVLGQRCYPSLADLPIVPDLVDVFRRVDALPAATAQAIAVGAPALWFQLGLRHVAAARAARDAGLFVVQDRCIKIEHADRREPGPGPERHVARAADGPRPPVH